MKSPWRKHEKKKKQYNLTKHNGAPHFPVQDQVKVSKSVITSVDVTLKSSPSRQHSIPLNGRRGPFHSCFSTRDNHFPCMLTNKHMTLIFGHVYTLKQLQIRVPANTCHTCRTTPSKKREKECYLTDLHVCLAGLEHRVCELVRRQECKGKHWVRVSWIHYRAYLSWSLIVNILHKRFVEMARKCV